MTRRPPSSRRGRRARSGGFTLIEMLVVLVIVSIVSGLIFASYQRVLDIRIRLAAFLDGTDAPTLIAGWFRDSIEGLLPDQTDGVDVFAGTARSLVGLSVAPIDGTPGVPTRIAWEIVFDAGTARTALRYRNGAAAAMTVASWPGDRGALRYCAPQLACFDSWPPPNQTVSQLPALIVLQAVRGTEGWPIAAAPQADRDPMPKIPNFAAPSS